MPWPAAGAALASFAALYITSDGYVGLILLAVLLVGTYFTKLRLPDRIVLLWIIRALAFGAIIVTAGYSKSFNISIFYEPAYVNRFGYMCAVELVLRAWTNRAKGPWLAEVIFLSALIIAAASNTFDHRIAFKTIAPIYVIFLILVLRKLGSPATDTTSGAAKSRWNTNLVVMRIVVAAVMIAFGISLIHFVEKYDNPITYWAVHLLRKQSRNTQNEIGLSPSPQVGPVFNPEPSTERVLRVRGDVSERHLRAMAFDSYERRAWRPILQERQFTAPMPPSNSLSPSQLASLIQKSGSATGSGMIQLRFDRLGDVLGLVITPLDTQQLDIEGGYEIDTLGTLRDSGEDVTRYDAVIARAQGAQGIAAWPMSDSLRARTTTIPEGTDPELITLAKRIASDGLPMERVLRISNYLRSNCRYSLAADPGQGDVISNFVLKTKAGHCVFFGSAVVVMSRAAGVPSRFVTGYYAHERAGGDEMIVRQRDAHAWAECWIDDVGWITIDATPAGGLPDQLFPKPSFLKRLWERITDFPARVREWFSGLRRSTIVILIGTLAIIAGIVWLFRHWPILRRRKSSAKSQEPSDPELADLARRFERALQKQQVPVSPHRTWREHISTLATPRSELYRQFVDAYDAARFGPVRVKPDRRLHAWMDDIERVPYGSLAANAPRKRGG